MNKLVAISVGVVASLAVPGAALAAPAGTTTSSTGLPTRIPLVNDCDDGPGSAVEGSCETLDGIGTFAGVVRYLHRPNGDLRLMIAAKAAPPHRSYQLEIYCGTTIAGTGRQVGVLPDAFVTDALGAAAGPFDVPAADVHEVCSGPSGTFGHLHLIDATQGSVLTAAPIRMAVG